MSGVMSQHTVMLLGLMWWYCFKQAVILRSLLF